MGDLDIPLYERLKQMNASNQSDAFASVNSSSNYKRIRKERGDSNNDSEKIKHKNAPAEMPSNRPVKRVRLDADNSERKFRDPRFSNISGELNNDKFQQAYSFLDEHQRNEVHELSKALKKTKNSEKKEQIRAVLLKNKQEITERNRAKAVKKKLDELKIEEREKVANGKKAYFIKNSKVKEVELDVKYASLKKEGKLHKYMEKKNRKNDVKMKDNLPARRMSY